MSYIILAVLFLFSGFFMKFSDDLFDDVHNVKLASLFGLLCGITSGIATVSDQGAAYIFLGVLIGNVIALKVDGIHHIIALAVFVFICLIGGFPNLSLAVLLICILGALGDEVGHEIISSLTDNTFLNMFFEYRFLMKIVVFLLAIFGAFNILVFVCFILFEVAYLLTGVLFEKLKKEVWY